MSFDEQPDGDPHGECEAEIKSLKYQLTNYRIAHEQQAATIADLRAQVNELEMQKVRQHNAQAGNSKILDAFHQRNEEQAARIIRLEADHERLTGWVRIKDGQIATVEAERIRLEAANAEARELLGLSQAALTHHIEQTRPIARSINTVAAIKELLDRQQRPHASLPHSSPARFDRGEEMTDKEKVLAKWPGAFAIYDHWNATRCRVYRGCSVNAGYYKIGSGLTESEAWANAAKGLE